MRIILSIINLHPPQSLFHIPESCKLFVDGNKGDADFCETWSVFIIYYCSAHPVYFKTTVQMVWRYIFSSVFLCLQVEKDQKFIPYVWTVTVSFEDKTFF